MISCYTIILDFSKYSGHHSVFPIVHFINSGYSSFMDEINIVLGLRVASKFLLSKMKALKFFIWKDLKTGSNTYILRIEPGTNIFNFYFILGQSKNCTYNMKGKAYKYLMRACCLEKLQSILYCASLQISRMWSKYRCASFQLNPLLLLPFSGNSCVGDCINHLWIGLDEPQGTAILQYDLVYMI